MFCRPLGRRSIGSVEVVGRAGWVHVETRLPPATLRASHLAKPGATDGLPLRAGFPVDNDGRDIRRHWANSQLNGRGAPERLRV